MPNVPRYRLFSGIKKRNSFQAAVCQYAERDAIGLITPLLLGYSVVTCLPAVHKRDDLRLFACFLISPRLNGGIVYGPIEYSFDSYYHRYLSQLENDIKEYWISTNAVSDADIDAFYSENQNLFSLNGDADVSAIYLSYFPSDLSADNIFLGLEEGVSLEDIQTQYPYVTDWHTYSFTNETEKSDLLSHADIVSQASSMNTGDVSEPFLDGTYPCIIKVTRKEDATVIPLAEVRNRITDYLLNSRISTETELIQNRLVFTETDAFQNTSIE